MGRGGTLCNHAITMEGAPVAMQQPHPLPLQVSVGCRGKGGNFCAGFTEWLATHGHFLIPCPPSHQPTHFFRHQFPISRGATPAPPPPPQWPHPSPCGCRGGGRPAVPVLQGKSAKDSWQCIMPVAWRGKVGRGGGGQWPFLSPVPCANSFSSAEAPSDRTAPPMGGMPHRRSNQQHMNVSKRNWRQQ